MKNLYLILALIGLIVPYTFFISFLLENGLNIISLLNQLFANDVSTFFAVDLIITALVFLVFSYREADRRQMRNWWVYLVATLLVGPSFSFPLFLYVREG